MSLKKILNNYKLITFTLVVYIVIGFYDISIFKQAATNTLTYLKEMIEVLPAVMILSGLISVWVPKEVILNNFGSDSGLKGKLISVFIGSISAGPIYAAFPITQSLLLKGASIVNVVIIISAWAVVKLPMLIVETKFLGLPFAATRFLLTVPFIIIMGIIVERLVSQTEVIDSINLDSRKQEPEALKSKVETILPGMNCGSCDYNSCSAYAEAIVYQDESTEMCSPGGDKLNKELKQLLKSNKQYI